VSDCKELVGAQDRKDADYLRTLQVKMGLTTLCIEGGSRLWRVAWLWRISGGYSQEIMGLVVEESPRGV